MRDVNSKWEMGDLTLCSHYCSTVRFDNVAVGDAGAHRECRIDQGVDIDALEIFANECQASMRTQIVGQFFDNEVGHACVHLQGEQYFTPKSLIYNGK